MTKIQLHEAAETVEDRVRVTVTCISEMRGSYPEIALPEDIDREALGDEAFFVTLPIGQAGAKSRNQRTYSRAAVEQMVAQINQQRPEGMWGHLKAEETQTRYDPPAIRWLAAMMDADGIAWGKGLPLTEATREYYRLAKATNARVGTSLVAWAQMDGSEVVALELAAVDLADPARVGVPVTAARAMLSKEMRTEEKQGEPTCSPLQEQALEALREMLGEGDVDVVIKRVGDLLEAHSALITEHMALRAERAALMDAAITAAVERVVVPASRGFPAALTLVEELVRAREPGTLGEINAAVTAVIEGEAVRSLLRAELQQAMGPSQRRPVRREGESGGYFEFS